MKSYNVIFITSPPSSYRSTEIFLLSSWTQTNTTRVWCVTLRKKQTVLVVSRARWSLTNLIVDVDLHPWPPGRHCNNTDRPFIYNLNFPKPNQRCLMCDRLSWFSVNTNTSAVSSFMFSRLIWGHKRNLACLLLFCLFVSNGCMIF